MRIGGGLGLCLCVTVVLGGAVLALGHGPATVSAPLPSEQVTMEERPQPTPAERGTVRSADPRLGVISASAADSAPTPVATVTPTMTPTPQPTRHLTPSLGPSRLSVPSLGLLAPLDPVGVRGGVLDTPADPSRVGWWSGGGTLSGTRGTVLVVGHVTWQGQMGAMGPLARISPASLVHTSDEHGTVTTWQVMTVSSRQRVADHGDLFDATGTRRLVLTTCGGEFIQGNYTHLVVIVAHPLEG